MENTMTIAEALKEGYTHCIYSNDGYQVPTLLTAPDEIDWSRNDIYLLSKQSYRPAGLDAKEIAEKLAEDIWCTHHEDTGDDTDDVYDAIKAIDFTDVEQRIEDVLKSFNRYYRNSGIKLIKERIW